MQNINWLLLTLLALGKMGKASTRRTLGSRICSLSVLIIVSLSLSLFGLGQAENVRAESNAVIAGVVLDESNNPICDAVVEALMFSSVSDIWFRTSTSTDCSGRFEMIVDREGAYRVYALCDRPETDGIDYVPAVWHTNVAFGSISHFSFVLMEGASLYLGEDLWFAESNKPADYYRFTVIDFEVPSNVRNPVTIYGTDSIQVGILGFEERVIIVPADREVGIRVYARNNDVVRQFRAKGAAGYFKLSKGEVLQVDIREHSLPFDIEKMRTLWRSAFSLLQDSEEAGFLVSLEREDLTNAYSLTEEAYFHLVARAYDTSFAKIRNAHVLISVTTERLQGLLETSSQSALLVLLFLVFMSSASAYLITERSDRLEISSIGRTFSLSVNLLIALAIYSLLVMAFYFLFPGCHLVPQNVFAIASVLSIVLGQIIVIIFPRVFSEKESEGRSIQLRSAIISAFSMACRNLRRRKIRTLLGLMNISILVFGFITFTSLSIGYGLVVQQLGPSNTAEGLLIRDEPPDPGHPSSFIPLPASFLRWLESQPNTSLISRKAQTTMASGENPIGYLYSKSGARMPIWGILGIIPVAEAQLVSLDSIVTEGEYLEDDDFYGILISHSFKDRLEVDVGAELHGFDQGFIIRGFFDPQALGSLRDIDGQPIVPLLTVEGQEIVYCTGDEVVILVYDRAIALPKVALSRVSVQLKNAEDYAIISEIVSLTMMYDVYISQSGVLQRKSIGGYLEEKGVAMFPFLILLVVLNVGTSMLGSVREREDEMVSLSSIGLNPTHVLLLFVAEAMVIGFVGGGFGYILGFGGYRLAASGLLGTLQVREKVSIEWGLVAFILSGSAAVIASLIPALKASTIVTPSLLRKWNIDERRETKQVGQEWIVDMPVKLAPRELEPFKGFVLKRLRENVGLSSARSEENEAQEGLVGSLYFKYMTPQQNTWSENRLVMSLGRDRFIDTKLVCTPKPRNLEETVHATASLIRKIMLEWNAIEFEVASPFDPTLGQIFNLVNAYNPSTLYVIGAQPDMSEELAAFKRGLVVQGLRPPKTVISKVDLQNLDQVMKATEEIATRADVVCISGEPSVLCTSLAISGAKHNKILVSVVDDRSSKERMEKPFKELRIVNVT